MFIEKLLPLHRISPSLFFHHPPPPLSVLITTSTDFTSTLGQTSHSLTSVSRYHHTCHFNLDPRIWIFDSHSRLVLSQSLLSRHVTTRQGDCFTSNDQSQILFSHTHLQSQWLNQTTPQPTISQTIQLLSNRPEKHPSLLHQLHLN